MTPEWVSITAYALQFSVTRKTVYKWLEAGLLDTFRVGRCIRVLNQPPTDRRPKHPIYVNRKQEER